MTLNFLRQQQPTPLDLLFKAIYDLWDLIDNGTVPEEQADEVLFTLNDESGAHLPLADLYDIVVYIKFRRTGTPPITIH
jgi:hypothetical protein